MGIENKKIAVLVDNYFEQVAFQQPQEMLKKIGAVVSVISTSTKNLRAIHTGKLGDFFKADILISDVEFDDYEGILLPGGVINADRLRMDERARRWAGHFIDTGKLVAVIGHAPWLLVSADLVEERRLTSYYTLQDDIRNAGGEWIDQPVVSDGNIITAQESKDIAAFVETIGQWFESY